MWPTRLNPEWNPVPLEAECTEPPHSSGYHRSAVACCSCSSWGTPNDRNTSASASLNELGEETLAGYSSKSLSLSLPSTAKNALTCLGAGGLFLSGSLPIYSGLILSHTGLGQQLSGLLYPNKSDLGPLEELCIGWAPSRCIVAAQASDYGTHRTSWCSGPQNTGSDIDSGIASCFKFVVVRIF